MPGSVPAHHPGPHRGGHAEPGCGLGVDFADLGVVGKSEIVIEAPNYLLFSPEDHPAADLTFKLGECKVTMCSFPVLADGAVVFHKLIEDICHCYEIITIDTAAKITHLAIGSATHAGHSGQKVGITAYFVEFCSCRLMGDGAQ